MASQTCLFFCPPLPTAVVSTVIFFALSRVGPTQHEFALNCTQFKLLVQYTTAEGRWCLKKLRLADIEHRLFSRLCLQCGAFEAPQEARPQSQDAVQVRGDRKEGCLADKEQKQWILLNSHFRECRHPCGPGRAFLQCQQPTACQARSSRACGTPGSRTGEVG